MATEWLPAAIFSFCGRDGCRRGARQKKERPTRRGRPFRFLCRRGLLLATATAFATVATATVTTVTAAVATTVTARTAVATATLTGCTLCSGVDTGVRRQVALAVNFTVADPNLDAEHADFGVSLCQCVVDVGTDGVERRTSFLEHLAASHFGAADAAGDLDLDALGAHAHRRSDGHLDGTTIRHTAFELAGDVVGHDVGVNLGTLHLEDVDLDVLVADLLELFLQFVDLLAAFADDDTRTGGVDGDGDEFERTLDDDLRQGSFRQTGVQILADLGVLEDAGRIVTVPVGIPTTDDTQTVADRIGLLSHDYASAASCAGSSAGFSFLVPTITVTWLERLRMRAARPCGAVRMRLS